MPLTDPNARMAHARAVMRDRFHEQARTQFARMGIEPTADQLAAAGDNLLKAAQRDRLHVARLTRWTAHADEKRTADVEWATEQARTYADRIRVSDPFRVCLMAVADELAAPDGFSRPRFIKRLDAYLSSARDSTYSPAASASCD